MIKVKHLIKMNMERLTFDILERVRNKDTKAYKLLQSRMATPIIGYARNHVKLTDEEAREFFTHACAEVFKTYLNQEKRSPTPEAFEAWKNGRDFQSYFQQVANNQLHDFVKKIKKMKEKPLNEKYLEDQSQEILNQFAVVETDEPINDQLIALDAAFKRLGQPCQDLIKEHYYLNQSWASIAQQKGENEATVRGKGNRCLATLKALMQQELKKLGF